MESIQEQMGQVAKGLQSLAEREDKLTYEWQEWRRRNEMRRIGEQTAQEARQREERRRSWKEVATMAAEVAITRMTQKILGWCAAKQAARSGKEGVARIKGDEEGNGDGSSGGSARKDAKDWDQETSGDGGCEVRE
jgi:dsDNA-specific endonuclease/ATPase MutS2